MILRAENIVKRYRSRTVVKGVSFQVRQGEIVGLLGPNGAGKTTSFYMVVGLIKPNEGKVFLEQEEITGDPMFRRAQKGIGYLAQEASVFRKLSVEDNIMGVLQMTSLSKEEQKKKLESLLDEFGLQHIRKNRGDLLSGGERRRTEIARALAVDPKFILLDEPFAELDQASISSLSKVLEQISRGKTLLIASHQWQGLDFVDGCLLLEQGHLLKQQPISLAELKQLSNQDQR